jgi:hypothetical protein
MSFSYGYNPKIAHPSMSNNIPMMRSGAFQVPFFFGGSQVPTDLFLAHSQYNGAKGGGFHKGSPSKTRPNDMDFTFKRGGKSKTHQGDMDFTTKLGNTVFHRKGHNIKMSHTMPFLK